MKTAVFLYDYTNIMALPWAEAGYTCYCFDGQHESGLSEGIHPNITNVGMWFNKDTKIDQKDLYKVIDIVGTSVDLVFGFPECTDLAVSGARHFASKSLHNPNFQLEAITLVKLVEALAELLDCKWALENPVSVLSTQWRKPDYIFNPYDYGGYLPEDDKHPNYPEYIADRDFYKKRTCIWAGNGFIMPEYKSLGLPKGSSIQYKKLGGKSLKTKNIRSATPRGFAKAVFLYNS